MRFQIEHKFVQTQKIMQWQLDSFFRQTVKTYFIMGKFCQCKLKLCCWKMENIHVKLIFILVFISSSAQIEVKVSYKFEILKCLRKAEFCRSKLRLVTKEMKYFFMKNLFSRNKFSTMIVKIPKNPWWKFQNWDDYVDLLDLLNGRVDRFTNF